VTVTTALQTAREVLDLLTRLTWSEATTALFSWIDAQAVCRGMISGYSDWRLPSVRELVQAANNGLEAATVGSFRALSAAAFFWSATTHVASSTENWAVNLGEGDVKSSAKKFPRSTICVRP
jgi:hypothetical protein